MPTVDRAPDDPSSGQRRPAEAAVDADSPGAEQTTESWDVIYLGGHPVGYQSLQLTKQTVGASVWLDATATSELSMSRFGQITREAIQMTSRESADGLVVQIRSRIQSGESEIVTVGQRSDDTLQMELQSGDLSRQWSLPLPPVCGGFFAIEWSLAQRPIEVDEERTLFAVVPMLNQVAEVTLTAGPIETVSLLSETVELRRIDQRLALPGGTILESILWADADGHVIKTEMADLQQVSYRVDRQTAIAAAQQASFDLGGLATIKVRPPLPNVESARQVRLQIRLGNRNPADIFPTTSGQSVVAIDETTAEIIVLTRRADAQSGGTRVDDPPRAADRQPSLMIQSDAPLITAMAHQILPLDREDRGGDDLAGGDGDSKDWALAMATERYVYEALTKKDFSTAFASAAEVARSRQGDCTEHAVLTAALCRARGIPARVLVGLVYVTSQQSFVFHMWNEVWIRDQWIPLDSTRGPAGIPPVYLILARSSLETGDAFSPLLTVMQVIGQLEIRCVGVDDQ